MAGSVFDNFFGEAGLGDIAAAMKGAGRLIRGAFSFSRSLNDTSRQLFQQAAELAAQLGSRDVDTEHLLVVLLNNQTVVAILGALNHSAGEIRRYVIQSYFPPTAKPLDLPLEEMGVSPRLKAAVELSLNAARELGYNQIGPEHLLIGLLEEQEGIAAQVLSKYQLTPHEIRSETVQIVGRGTAESHTSTPRLNRYGRDLTALAKRGALDPVIGRVDEIETIIEILARRNKNNPLLVGEPGVGKTAIVEGLAQRIINEDVPEVLRNRRVVELNLNSLVAGSQYRGQFEARIKSVLDEIIRNKHELIVFIDEVHLMVGAGQAGEGAMDVANVFKPAMARGDLHLIGATTLNEYNRYIEKDAALERRFQPVLVAEPTVAQTIDILRGLRDRFEAHHKVTISDGAIQAAASLADRYIPNRHLPDKAIDLLDQAAARVHVGRTSRPVRLQEMQAQLRRVRQELEYAQARGQQSRIPELKTEISRMEQHVQREVDVWKRGIASGTSEVSAEDIAIVLGKLTGIPVTELSADERDRLRNMESIIEQRVVGQSHAVKAVAGAIRLARAGLRRGKHPIATFLFVGPSGVGKTELAKALAQFMFNDEDAVIRLDMSEYSERHTVARLVGAPPGYQGYEEGGQLTELVRRRPYSIVLLDEIEKAHPEVMNILLQVFDDARLTDSRGKTADFSNTIIIATSNLPVESVRQMQREGDTKVADDRQMLAPFLQAYFKPELLNRIDEIIVFNELSHADIEAIVHKQLEYVRQHAALQGIEVNFEPSLVEHLVKDAYRRESGARELQRRIRAVETAIAETVLGGQRQPVRLAYIDGTVRALGV